MQLIDHDVVETVNLGTQAFRLRDVGAAKVSATADLMRELNPELGITVRVERFSRSMRTHPIVFCCVDGIDTRRHIFAALASITELFIDGRMAAEALRVLTVSDTATAERYRRSLFPESEAYAEGCTARSTLYCAGVAAGLMVGQLAKHLRDIQPDFNITLNLLATELSAC